MKHRRRSGWRSRPRASAIVLAGGLALGLLAAVQIVTLIREARSSGMFGPPPIIAVEPRDNKRTEEDRLVAHALAAAIGAQTAEDCRSLGPRHRQGCLAYVEERRANPLPGPSAPR